MEYICRREIKELSNPGVVSRQIISPENSDSVRITITEVHLEAGACQTSEQIWYALKGKGQLLLSNDVTKEFSEGDAVRFASGDIHGLLNNSANEFTYLSVTSPPIDFSYAYKNKK